MTRTRLMLPLLAAVVAIVPAVGGNGRKGKTDAQVEQLSQSLRTDPDEKKRQAAIAELREADPRAQTEVIPALVFALQRDRSPQVRADAAEALGQFKTVFPVAGLALEAATVADPAPIVRRSSQQALWEYYLGGYRTIGGDEVPGSTPEPPIAPPESPPVVLETTPAPSPAIAPPPRAVAVATPQLPPRPTLDLSPILIRPLALIPLILPVPPRGTDRFSAMLGGWPRVPVAPDPPTLRVISSAQVPPLPLRGTDRFSALLGGWPRVPVSTDPPTLRVIFSTAALDDMPTTEEPPLAPPLDIAPRAIPTGVLVSRPATAPSPTLPSASASLSAQSSLSHSALPDWMLGLPDVALPPNTP